MAATVALATYRRAVRTGVGDVIDLSSVAHTAGMLEGALIGASYLGVDPDRLGSRLLNPWHIFTCAEPATEGDTAPDPDLLFLVTVEQDQWERLVELMGHPDWLDSGLFDTMEQRHENDDLLKLFLGQWTVQHGALDLWHDAQRRRICFAPVFTMAALEQQAHLRERGFFHDVEHPRAGAVTHLGPPFRSTPSLHRTPGPAPMFDRHARPSFGPGRPVDGPPPVRSGQAGEPLRPLDGLRVLDLSWVWAGPYCTMHLANLGAEVIKIESAQRPGLGRRLPFSPPDVDASLNTSAYFNQWDQGKLSCRLDLRRPEAVELFKAMTAEADVVVENFATGVMDKLGLGYRRLRSIKPDLIMASISGYGEVGPLRHYMGYGPTTGPLSGLSSLTGYPGGPPRELGISVGDPAAGITTALAVCAAVVAREATGEGRHIDTSLWEATAVHTVEGWMAHTMTGRTPERMGNRDPVMAPHGCYRTAPEPGDESGSHPLADRPDPGRWITIACPDDRRWTTLAELIDPALTADPRYRTAADRKANEDALDATVAAWVADQNRWDLTKRLQAAGVAAFPSMSPMDLLGDAHLRARGFFERLDHPEVGRRVHTGMPWRSTTGPNGVPAPAPLLGQHTDQVLATILGMSDAQIRRFRDRGVLD